MWVHTFISRQLQRNLEDLQLKLMYLLYQRHKRLGVDLCQATSVWKIRRKFWFVWLTSCLRFISTEELEDLNQICVKQLKNRYNDPTVNKRFILGIDRAKMKLYDVEQVSQKDLTDSGQEEDEVIFDNTPFGGKGKKYEKFSDLRSKVKYYHDINIETKEWEVIELPSRKISSCRISLKRTQKMSVTH